MVSFSKLDRFKLRNTSLFLRCRREEVAVFRLFYATTRERESLMCTC